MQTPAMNITPIAAVVPAPQRPSSASANAPANAGGFDRVLAREVSQQGARLKEQGSPDDRGSTAAAADGNETRTDTAGAKPAPTGDNPDGVTAQADTTPAEAASEVVTDGTAANGLLALVDSLAPKPAAVARAEGAVSDAGDGGPASLRAARGGDVAGNGVTTGLAAGERADIGVEAAAGRSNRQGGAGRASGDAFAAAVGRVAEEATRNDGARSTPLETAPDPALRAASIAMSPLVSTAIAGADRLAPRVGSTAWDHALGQRVVWMAGAHEQTASLTLNPPDLGPLQVVLSVTNNQADAMFVAAQPEVRQALEAALPRLREMLGDAGVTLREATVSADSRESQQAFRQSQGNGGGARGTGQDVAEADVRTVASPVRSGRSLVDTFA